MPDKIVVAMSSSVTFLTELSDACGGGGFPAAVQRRSHENNVTWFQFILDTREDGRLVPKQMMTVCHVWLADSVVAMETESTRAGGWSYTVRLPRKSPDSTKTIKDVFAIAFRIDSLARQNQFLSRFSRQVTQQSESVPFGGSSEIYRTFVEVDARSGSGGGRIVAPAEPVVCIREVLNDVHQFLQLDAEQAAGRTQANNANNGLPTEQLLVIEYTG